MGTERVESGTEKEEVMTWIGKKLVTLFLWWTVRRMLKKGKR